MDDHCEVHGERLEASLAMIAEHDRHAIARYGWAAHYIVGGIVPSAHTHGLMERFEHPDLQVVLPAAPETLRRLLTPLALAVTKGRVFRAGQEAGGVFTLPVRFIERREGRRMVLRALFPDPKGRWPDDVDVEPGYGRQLAEVE